MAGILALLSNIIEFGKISEPTFWDQKLVFINLFAILMAVYIVGLFTDFNLSEEWQDAVELAERKKEKAFKRAKGDVAKIKTEKDRLEDWLTFYLSAGDLILSVVGVKHDRLDKLKQNFDTESHYDEGEILAELKPKEQVNHILLAVYKIIQEHFKIKDGLRIGYYKLTESSNSQRKYELKIGWDGTQKELEKIFFSPFDPRYEQNYTIDYGPVKSIICMAGRNKKIQIVSDCDSLDTKNDAGFRYFDIEQKERFRSLLAIPLMLNNSLSPITHVVTIDSTTPNVFDESEDSKKVYEFIQKHMAQRVLYEDLLQELFDSCN